mmetsp:Transcript_1967/g.4246  ORF Transcript_1967/g.4246 Transcript_1967/m.4246 type:complete len:953 (+) Transcript_1967:242-3100(+)
MHRDHRSRVLNKIKPRKTVTATAHMQQQQQQGTIDVNGMKMAMNALVRLPSYLSFLSRLALCLMLATTPSNALLVNNPSSPSSSASTSTLSSSSSRQLLIAPLYSFTEKNAERHGAQQEEDENVQNNNNSLFDSVGNLFQQLFTNAVPNMSMPSTPFPNLNLSDLTSSLPKVHIPDFHIPNIHDFLASSSIPPKENEKYQQVNDFDANLAKDIEEALQLANDLAAERGLGDNSANLAKDIEEALQLANNLAAKRGLGDMVIINTTGGGGDSNHVREKKPSMFHENNAVEAIKNERLARAARRSSADNKNTFVRESSGEAPKPSLFGENNSANWNQNAPKQKHTPSRQQEGGGGLKTIAMKIANENNANVGPKKPSMFRDNNAATTSSLPQQKLNRANGPTPEGKSYMNTADVKQLFQDNNAANNIPQAKLNRGNNNATPEGKNYANTADVKQHEFGRQSSGYTSRDGLNSRKLDSFVDVAGVKYHAANSKASSYPIRHFDSNPKATESDSYVDAATAAAKAAWDEASSPFHSSNNNIPSPPMQGDTLFSQGRNLSFATGKKMDRNSNNIDRDGGYASREASVRGYGIQDMDNGVHGGFQQTPKSPTSQEMNASKREKNAQETYNRYKEYFDGDVGGVDDSPVHNYNFSRKIFITEQALELARSLKLDIYEIFQYKNDELGLDDEGAMVNENDVRDYLDQRYEQLLSVLSTDKDRTVRSPQQVPRREHSMDSVTRRRQDYLVRNDDMRMEDSDYGLREARQEYFDSQKEHEDTFDRVDTPSQHHGYTPEQWPQPQRLSHQQRLQKEEMFNRHQTNNNHSRRSPDSDIYNQRSNGYSSESIDSSADNMSNVRQNDLIRRQAPPMNRPTDDEMSGHRPPSYSISPIASVPLSQLISNGRTDQMERRAQHSSQAEFRQPYQEQQQERNGAYPGQSNYSQHPPSAEETGENASQSAP